MTDDDQRHDKDRATSGALPADERSRAAARVGEPHEADARQTFSWLIAHALGGVTHSIVNPLSQLETEEPGESLSLRQRALLTLASGGATRLMQLNDDILLLTHAAAQTVEVSLESVPLTTLLREAIEQAQTPDAPDPPRDIRSHATPALPLALCDPALARRALAALIENALRFSPHDTPVTVEARKLRDRAVIRVHDDGPGVAPEAAPRLFAALTVGARPRNHVGVGLGIGLGLAVARICAEAQGGGVRLEPPAGAGTTFILELPFAPIAATPSD